MKLSDFKIGTTFYSCTGQSWRCTDVGKRTILAIELKPELDASWFIGPPYAVVEVPFDEDDMRGVFRNDIEAIQDAIDSADHSAHPNFPQEAVTVMSKARFTEDRMAYPNQRIFRTDRVAHNHHILHPYSAELDGNTWVILVYELFSQAFSKIAEAEFIKLSYSTEAHLRQRRDEFKQAER